jgi:hypothetical protein
MSTFLQLCQDLRREAGISGTDSMPAAVTSQTGEMKRVVEWVKKAYRDIQNLHPNWHFLSTEFSFQTISSTSTYTKNSVSLTELGSWDPTTFRAYLTATGVTDEQELRYWPNWHKFRDAYLIGASRSTSGRPTDFSIKPDKSIVLWPTPSAAYTVVGEYFKRAQELSANADEPLFPQEFHDILVWRAIVFYAAHEAAPEVYAHGKSEYNRLLRALRRDQLPMISIAGEMA